MTTVRSVKIIYRPDALNDIEAIEDHIYEHSQSNIFPQRALHRLFRRIERIGLAPLGGKPRDDLTPGLRTVPFEDKAVIAYLAFDDRIEIVRVFYGGRDWETVLAAKPPAP
jgi:toxin ParE1/3/4